MLPIKNFLCILIAVCGPILVSGCSSLNIGDDLLPIDISGYSLPDRKYLISSVTVTSDKLAVFPKLEYRRAIENKLVESGFFSMSNQGCDLKVKIDHRFSDPTAMGSANFLLMMVTIGLIPTRWDGEIHSESKLVCEDEEPIVVSASSDVVEILGWFARFFGRSHANTKLAIAAGITTRLARKVHSEADAQSETNES